MGSWLMPATAKVPKDKQFVIEFNLRKQFRSMNATFSETKEGGIEMQWTQTRDMNTYSGSFVNSAAARAEATRLCYIAPTPGDPVIVPDDELFAFIPTRAFDEMRKEGLFRYNNTEFILDENSEISMGYKLLHLKDYDEGTEIWVIEDKTFPLICRMKNNPIGIDWEIRLK